MCSHNRDHWPIIVQYLLLPTISLQIIQQYCLKVLLYCFENLPVLLKIRENAVTALDYQQTLSTPLTSNVPWNLFCSESAHHFVHVHILKKDFLHKTYSVPDGALLNFLCFSLSQNNKTGLQGFHCTLTDCLL